MANEQLEVEHLTPLTGAIRSLHDPFDLLEVVRVANARAAEVLVEEMQEAGATTQAAEPEQRILSREERLSRRHLVQGWLNSGHARDLRHALNLTCRDVGLRIGVRAGSVSRWERGEQPNSRLIDRVAEVYLDLAAQVEQRP